MNATVTASLLRAYDLGPLIRLHRTRAGLSRQDLADLSGVGTTAIYDVEHGKETVQLRTVLRLCDALSIRLHVTSPLLDTLTERSERPHV